MKLGELIADAVFEDAATRGLIRRQTHPDLPLTIYNYTERAAYEGVWNEATLTCRGLIVNEETGDVVARPFPKFFNYGQPGAPDVDLETRSFVTDKLDGSLGILYPMRPGEWAVATRGSFQSEQALHATEVLRARYGSFRPTEGLTYLFEIVYPENRIVVDYEGLDDLVLLGAVDIATGRASWRPLWPGPRVQEFHYRSLSEALAAEPRPNSEGLVVYQPSTGHRIKIKQADYVALHRIVTGLNKRTVWAHMGAGLPLEDLIAPLPDEFRPWVEDVAAELAALVASQAREIEQEFKRIIDVLYGSAGYLCDECGGALAWGSTSVPAEVSSVGWFCTTGQCSKQFEVVRPERRAFAEIAKESKWSWALFLRLDGRNYGPKLWKHAKPEAVTPSGRVYSEDVA